MRVVEWYKKIQEQPNRNWNIIQTEQQQIHEKLAIYLITIIGSLAW